MLVAINKKKSYNNGKHNLHPKLNVKFFEKN